jgi:hypothetical protein
LGGRVAVAGLAALLVALALAGTAWGQTPTPTGGGSPAGCQAGELCVQDTPTAAPTGVHSLVGTDPPSHFARSLVTMGFIALILGAYLLTALTGKRLPRRRAGGRS